MERPAALAGATILKIYPGCGNISPEPPVAVLPERPVAGPPDFNSSA